MKSKHVDLAKIPNVHLKGIGTVALAWSFLEGAIERIIWRMLRVSDHQGIAVTTHLNLPTRLNMALALVSDEFSDSDELAQLKELTNRIMSDRTIDGKEQPSLSHLRGRAVHNRLIAWLDTGDIVRPVYKGRRKIASEAKPVDEREYGETTAEILSATDEAIEILRALTTRIAAIDGAPSP